MLLLLFLLVGVLRTFLNIKSRLPVVLAAPSQCVCTSRQMAAALDCCCATFPCWTIAIFCTRSCWWWCCPHSLLHMFLKSVLLCFDDVLVYAVRGFSIKKYFSLFFNFMFSIIYILSPISFITWLLHRQLPLWILPQQISFRVVCMFWCFIVLYCCCC